MQRTEKPATLTKREVMRYLRTSEARFQELVARLHFPRPVPILNKWHKDAVDNWLASFNKTEDAAPKEQDWRDFIGE